MASILQGVKDLFFCGCCYRRESHTRNSAQDKNALFDSSDVVSIGWLGGDKFQVKISPNNQEVYTIEDLAYLIAYQMHRLSGASKAIKYKLETVKFWHDMADIVPVI